MHYFNKFFFWLSILAIAALCSPHISSAAGITITGKGLYHLVPSRKMNSIDDRVLHLEKFVLVENTEKIEAVKGTSFGFEFILDGPAPISTVLKIYHPKIISPTGVGYITISSYPIKINPGKKYFAGWSFTADKELQPGRWSFEFDLPESPSCEFQVLEVEELVYDGKQIKSGAQNRNKNIPETAATEPELKTSLTGHTLPSGETLTRYLVRGGIFLSLKEAKAKEKVLKDRGYKPFVFVREKSEHNYEYYLFICMFDTEKKLLILQNHTGRNIIAKLCHKKFN